MENKNFEEDLRSIENRIRDWRMRTNYELKQVTKETDILRFI